MQFVNTQCQIDIRLVVSEKKQCDGWTDETSNLWIYFMYFVVQWARAGRPADRGSISGRGERIFRLTSGAHPASCTMGTGGPFPGAKARMGPNADHSPPSSAEVEND
jgi:hypothetical protein